METFGGNDNLNLKAIDKFLAIELQERISELGNGVSIQGISPLERIAGKGYTARAEADIYQYGRPLGGGKIYSVLFRLGEGTGDTKDHCLAEVPPNWNPRKKEGYAELFLAMGTGFLESWFSGLNFLSAYGLDDSRTGIQRYKSLNGSASHFYSKLPLALIGLGNKIKLDNPAPNLDLTFDRGEVPYGDPHAIVFERAESEVALRAMINPDPLFQVASFITFPIKDEGYEMVKEVIERSKKVKS